MGNLKNNLSRYEMCCECCDFDTVDWELAEILQEVCDHFAAVYHTRVELKITGPNRCKLRNSAVGGAPNSQHLYGRAADFKIFHGDEQVTPREIYDYLDKAYPKRLGVGLYDNRVHLDTREDKARWKS
jgi:uncharacterized protein YcbK (DUF882 family)